MMLASISLLEIKYTLDELEYDRIDPLRRLIMRTVSDARERHEPLDVCESPERAHAFRGRPRVLLTPTDPDGRTHPRVSEELLGERTRRVGERVKEDRGCALAKQRAQQDLIRGMTKKAQ